MFVNTALVCLSFLFTFCPFSLSSILSLFIGAMENFSVASASGLERECVSRYGPADGYHILRLIFDVLEFLPLCATVEIEQKGEGEVDNPKNEKESKQSKRSQKIFVVTGERDKKCVFVCSFLFLCGSRVCFSL